MNKFPKVPIKDIGTCSLAISEDGKTYVLFYYEKQLWIAFDKSDCSHATSDQFEEMFKEKESSCSY